MHDGRSERAACHLAGVTSSVLRYMPRDDGNAELRERLKVLAGRHRRQGYRMLHARLLQKGNRINVKAPIGSTSSKGSPCVSDGARSCPPPSGKLRQWRETFPRGDQPSSTHRHIEPITQIIQVALKCDRCACSLAKIYARVSCLPLVNISWSLTIRSARFIAHSALDT